MRHSSLGHFSNTHVSAYWFLIKLPDQHPIIFGILYSPPNLLKNQSEVTIEHILSSIAKYTSKHKTAKILLCGDFNNLNTSEHLILTDIEEYKSAGCVKEAPILTNDHCAIAIPSANCIPKPKYHPIKKRIITQSAKIALTQELSSITWNEMYKLESADEKVNYPHSTVNKIYDKHCPIKNIRAPVNKPYISSPLTRKLQRAKRTAYNNHKLCFKFLSKQIASLQKSALHKMTDDNINTAMKGTKRWWNNIKQLSGDKKITNDHASAKFIDNVWLSTEELTHKLNSYYVENHNKVDFPEIPAEGISIDIPEHKVFKLLEDMGGHSQSDIFC